MLDLSALTRDVTATESADLQARRRRGEFGQQSRLGAAMIVFLVVFGVFFVNIGAFVLQAFVRVGAGFGGTMRWLPILPIALFALVAGGVIIGIVRSWRRRDDWMHLALLARENGMFYRFNDAGPQYPGLIFGVGSARVVSQHVWSPEGSLADVGTHTYETGSGEDSTTHHWGFAAYRLGRAVPHLLLDSRSNSGLPQHFQHRQRLQLGDPVDRVYDVYAPEGYQQDAYHVLSPDVLEALVELRGAVDIELVDDWLFVYWNGGDLMSPDVWQRVDWVRERVVERIAHGSYVDRRPQAAPYPVAMPQAAPGVAPEGRRLRGSLGPAWAIALVVLVFVLGTLAQLFVFGRFFMH